MLNTQLNRFNQEPIPMPTSWLLGVCMEARGKQELWTRQKPEVLEALREQSIIQSVESSNRIEGVTVEKERLRPVVLGQSKPRDRSEEELVGYRRALSWIFAQKSIVKIDARVLLRLHKLAQNGFSGDAGKWKARDNEILEINARGERRVRFVPTSARQTPKAIEQLCGAYEELLEQDGIPPLLSTASLIFDFLCIHPFRDGNGRVSRLLTTLVLQNHGFRVSRYISLERIIEESKLDYYSVLERCSKDWHEGKNEIVPWWNYWLGVLKRGYAEFEERIEQSVSKVSTGKSELIRQAILLQVTPFTLADIQAEVPNASSQLIKKVFAALKDARKLKLKGHGRGAKWEVI